MTDTKHQPAVCTKKAAMLDIDTENAAACHGHQLVKLTPDASEIERDVLHWLADGHEILWIPIYEISPGPGGLAAAKTQEALHGGPRLIRDVTGFFVLPIGIKGWLFPAHLDDTDVVCTRPTAREVSFATLIHPITGQRLTYQFPTETSVLVPGNPGTAERGL